MFICLIRWHCSHLQLPFNDTATFWPPSSENTLLRCFYLFLICSFPLNVSYAQVENVYKKNNIVPVKAGEVKNKHPVSAYLLFLIYTLSNNTHKKKTLLWSKMRAWMVVTKATGSRGDIACRVADSHSRRQRRAALGGQLAKFTVCRNVKTSPRILMRLWNLYRDKVMAPHLNKPLCCVSRKVYSNRIIVAWLLFNQLCWLF